MQNDRDTATHDRESAKSSASIALGTLGRMSEWFARPVLFISLEAEVLLALRAELEGKRVEVTEGFWGYRVMVYFPYPSP